MANTKLDDASWHDDGNAPIEQTAAHIAFYFCWLLQDGLIKNELQKEWSLSVPLNRSVSPFEYLSDYSDEKLFTDDMTDEVKAFSIDYYAGGQYYEDYCSSEGFDKDHKAKGDFTIKDTWDNAERVASMLRTKFEDYRT